jgi:hypothetical protein
MRTLRRLWRGDEGLARTFWLWNVLISQISASVFGGAMGAIAAVLGAPIIIVMCVGLISIWLFLSIATWRAAGQYQGRRLWAVLARIDAVVGVIFGVLYLLIAQLPELTSHI